MTPELRLHSLDAVRAFALLCGIVVHATMSFSPAFATVGWPIVDVSPSRSLQAVFHVLHSFRMTLFFLIAGFFARVLLQRLGPVGFCRNRLKRIAAPLIVGWVTLIPLVVAAIVWAVIRKHGGPQGDGSAAAAMAGRGVPLAHLWFLYYLLLIYAIVMATRWIVQHIDPHAHLANYTDSSVRWLVQKHTAVLVLPIPLAACLHLTSNWIPWTGIPTPQVGLTPHPAALTGFVIAFVFGWFLHRQQALLAACASNWQLHFLIAAATSAVSISIVGLSGGPAAVSSELDRLAYALCYAFSTWSWVLAILGFGVRYLSTPNPALRYLADSSYWMYLVHLPLVFALQGLVMQWEIHWSIKFTMIVVVTFALLLASYRYFVRTTFVGGWLNGRRYAAELGNGDGIGARIKT